MHITRVGFGAWRIGGRIGLSRPCAQDDHESIGGHTGTPSARHNWIDRPAIYGWAIRKRSSAVALKICPSSRRPYVFTKGGLRRGTRVIGSAGRRSRSATRRPVSGHEWKTRCAGSSGRGIDLYQMHWRRRTGLRWQEYRQHF